jgi:2-polyprenyl-3-methyl-5-hydroxy-6-metoxy-1,4-benzoquinol methylase
VSAFRNWAAASFERAMELNLRNIERAMHGGGGSVLDVGCGDGERTLRFARAARASEIHGVEITPEHAAEARARGVEVAESSLDEPLPYDDRRFDVVLSNQVIEHLADTDLFVRECVRVSRGVVVTSTENLASWHNVAALVFGWQPFSLTNVSQQSHGLGNPIAVHRGDEPVPKTWEHLRVFAHRGLRELHEAHGLVVDSVMGAGYYPLPARVGSWDTRHAAFLTVVARRRTGRPVPQTSSSSPS